MLAREPISAEAGGRPADHRRSRPGDLGRPPPGQIQGFFNFPFDHLTAMPLLSGYIKEHLGSPDEIVVARPTPAGSRAPSGCGPTCTRTWRSSTSAARGTRRTRSSRSWSSARSRAAVAS